MRLEDKVAVITGGAGGIGEAAAARFLEEGASVLLVDLDAGALAEVAARLGSNRVSYHVGDVTKAADNQAMIDTATERYGGVDIFLANAGIEGDVVSLLDYPEQRFDELMAINVKGPFLGLRAAIPAMRLRGGGSVIITSSIAGLTGAPRLAPYATSKHAVIGLMRSAAKEFAPEGIRVKYRKSVTCEYAYDALDRTRHQSRRARRGDANDGGRHTDAALRRASGYSQHNAIFG